MFLSHLNVVILAARELPDSEPEQADKYNSGAVQPADLQSSRLPRRGQHGAQVRDSDHVLCCYLGSGDTALVFSLCYFYL